MSTTDEAENGSNRGRVAKYAGVLAGVVLSGCSSLTPRQPLNEDPSGLDPDRLSGRSTSVVDPNGTQTASPTPTATATPTSTQTPTPTATEEPATATETARPPDAKRGSSGGAASGGSSGGGESGGGSFGGGGGSGGTTTTPTPTASPESSPTPTTTPEGTATATPTPTETETRAPGTPVDVVTTNSLSTPLSHTVSVSDREMGYLCLVDVDAPVSLSFSGETVEGGAVNWYLCDPSQLDTYWAGGTQAVFASFTDWPTFDFGPFTTGAGPTALVVEPVDEPVTLTYSISLE
jgi:hypothetical protein